MYRRHQWTEDLDVQTIRTPIHARNEYHHVDERDPKVAKRNRVVLFSFAAALVFCMIIIVMYYDHQYFIPFIGVGSIGVFTLAVFIFNDMLVEK